MFFQIRNFSYSIGQKKILHEIDFQLNTWDRVAIRGENGAGKSTLLRKILQFHRYPESMEYLSPDLKRVPFSYLGHRLGLYASLSIEENLRFFHSLSKYSFPWKKIQYWVELLSLQNRWEDPVYTLSRGMKQKTALLRAISLRPICLLLDEPFTSLDEPSSQNILNILQEISKDMSIVAVLHGYHSPFWEKNLELNNGRIV